VIQTLGVDFRDALVTFVNYFAYRLKVPMKLLMTIHDEARYLVADAYVERAAYVLQLAHLYVRALFIEAFQLDGIPQSCAWFSAVDVDHVWRKASVPSWKDGEDEDNAACITPSQPAITPYGRVIKPTQVLVA
jgi:DNA polymerase gamma 1